MGRGDAPGTNPQPNNQPPQVETLDCERAAGLMSITPSDASVRLQERLG